MALRHDPSRTRCRRAAQSPTPRCFAWEEIGATGLWRIWRKHSPIIFTSVPGRPKWLCGLSRKSTARSICGRLANLGKGALIVTAHFGLFELGGLLLAQRGFDSVVLTYPEPSRALTEWRAAFRKRWKVDTLEVGTDNFAFLQIAERLREGPVRRRADRPASSHGQHAGYVAERNRAIFPSGILVAGGAYGGVPVIPATMVRRADGAYHAQIFPPLLIEPRGSARGNSPVLQPADCGYASPRSMRLPRAMVPVRAARALLS